MKHWKIRITVLLTLAMMVTTVFASASSTEDKTVTPIMSPWAQEEVKRARELGLITEELVQGEFPDDLPKDYRQPITREQFRKVAMSYVALQEHCSLNCLNEMVPRYIGETEPGSHYAKEIFTDGSSEDSVAYFLGIVKGREDGSFDPKGLITRQEAAVMVTRAYEAIGGTMPIRTAKVEFKDSSKIAIWAEESTKVLSAWKIMNGLGDGTFAPEGQYSVEQCIVTFLRLYENGAVSLKNDNVTPLFTIEQAMQYAIGVNTENPAFISTLQVEGPEATFIQMEGNGIPHSPIYWLFVYRDGGVREVDFGLCTSSCSYYPELKDPHFSEDGKKFYFTIVTTEDQENYGKKRYYHDKGIYSITADLDTGLYQVTRENLPA